MFKHQRTGLIFNNRLDAIITMGTSRYRKALKNKEFEWNYILQGDERPVNVINRKENKDS